MILILYPNNLQVKIQMKRYFISIFHVIDEICVSVHYSTLKIKIFTIRYAELVLDSSYDIKKQQTINKSVDNHLCEDM